jgi:hypothetical protein
LHDQLLRFELSRDVAKFSLVAARERGGREGGREGGRKRETVTNWR